MAQIEIQKSDITTHGVDEIETVLKRAASHHPF